MDGLIIDDIQPPPSKQREILNSMILQLREEEFHAKHRPVECGQFQNSIGDDTDEGMVRHDSQNYDSTIRVDESMGVYGVS